jgi:hypothetical protein
MLSMFFVCSNALAWQEAVPTGTIYVCSNLNKGGTFSIDGDKVHFIMAGQDVASPAANRPDPQLTPPGSGGHLIALTAWAAGTVVRLPDAAFALPRSFRLPWANLSFQGYGGRKGSGICVISPR